MIGVPEHVFREYDVRGLVGKELTSEGYELFGKAFGTLLSEKSGGRASCAVGRDNRASSKEFESAFIKGLLSTGCDVVRIGEITTPGAYFANSFLKTTGAAAVTASHNPPEYNGLKMRFRLEPVSGVELGRYVSRNVFTQGNGRLKSRSIKAAYTQATTKGLRLKKPLKVVVDAGNGVAGPYVVAALKRIGARVIPLFCKPDSKYPNHQPNPIKPENFPWLIKAVRQNKADLGLMLDGDGDRVAAVDEKANIIWPDMLLLLFAREELALHKGAPIVVEIKCSQSVIDDIESRGGKAILSRTGYTNVEKTLAQHSSRIGAEMSGHFYFIEKTPWLSDAIHASARLCKLVSDAGKPLSQLISDAPKYYSSQEYRLHVTSELAEKRKYEIVAEVAARFKATNKVIDIDGARVLFEDGWGLIRCSKNEPELSLRFEGKTPEALARITGVFRKALSNYASEVKVDF